MPIREIERFAVSHLQVLDEQGQVDRELEPDLDEAALHRLYGAMVLAREADQRMLKLQRQGRIGTFAPCTGQEAASCGPVFAMRPTDWFVGAFRELGGRLMRGEPLENYLAFHAGWEEGNVLPREQRTLPYSIIVAGQLLHAVGIGRAMQYQGEHDTAVVAFLGDGATSEGDFHEALNFAAVWKAPVVFVCQNNGWAISLPVAKQTAVPTLAQKAIAYGVPSLRVDGNDVLATVRATREALARARSGGGPTFIEAVTYRLMMHTTSDAPHRYRTKEEEQAWWQRDPLRRLRLLMETRGLWDDERQTALEAEVRAQVDAAVRRAEAHAPRAPERPFDHVLGTEHDTLAEQKAEFLAELGRERGDG